jgi:hypothetical protein
VSYWVSIELAEGRHDCDVSSGMWDEDEESLLRDVVGWREGVQYSTAIFLIFFRAVGLG